MLEYLVREYDAGRADHGVGAGKLWTECGIMRDVQTDPVEPVLRAVNQLCRDGMIEQVGTSFGMPFYLPTNAGTAHARQHLCPWYVKTLRAVGVGSILRGVVVTAWATMIVAFMATWGGGVWP